MGCQRFLDGSAPVRIPSGMPYHPMVVHLPLAFALTAPILGITALFLTRRGYSDRSIWVLNVIWQVLMAATAYGAMATGELDAEQVEAHVGKELVEWHEKAATIVLFMSLGSAALAALAAKKGGLFEPALVILQVGILAAAIVTGKLGGELIYVHGGLGTPEVQKTKTR